MKRRALAIAILLVYTLTASGCGYEVFSRKFVRKKKKPTGPPAVYHIEPFVKPANATIYSRAFLYWKTWEGELLAALSPAGYPRAVNNLRVKECLRQAVSNLNEMRGCLNAKKAQELEVYIKELQQFDIFLEKQDSSDMMLARMRQDIESHKRNVDIRFSPSAVKNDMAPEPLPAEGTDTAQR